MLNNNKKNLGQNQFYHIKLRLLFFFLQLLLILIINFFLPLHPNSSYYQMYMYKRQKRYIINIMRQPKPVS